jgi:hypothetical protein
MDSREILIFPTELQDAGIAGCLFYEFLGSMPQELFIVLQECLFKIFVLISRQIFKLKH